MIAEWPGRHQRRNLPVAALLFLTDWCGSALEELFRISERKKREAI